MADPDVLGTTGDGTNARPKDPNSHRVAPNGSMYFSNKGIQTFRRKSICKNLRDPYSFTYTMILLVISVIEGLQKPRNEE